MNGRIDEVTYFDKELTSTEVSSIYTPTTPVITVPTSIKSTGKFIDNSNNVLMRQTMVATFGATGGAMKINDYNETVNHLLP